MPPKPKFTKEEIVTAALNIVSKKGIEALTAQELKTALNSSASPIFTLFDTMEEIREEVRIAAMQKFEAFAKEEIPDLPLFKQIGIKMIQFGIAEPKLYQLLFMRENGNDVSFDSLFGELGDTAAICIKAIERDYSLSSEQAEFLFKNMWIYTFGIGALCATKVCRFSEKESGEMLTSQFKATMLLINEEK